MSLETKNDEFKSWYLPGVVVKLNSGGPTMTITEVGDDGIVQAAWFVSDVLHRDAFHYKELVLPRRGMSADKMDFSAFRKLSEGNWLA